jgi:hypothetical protein
MCMVVPELINQSREMGLQVHDAILVQGQATLVRSALSISPNAAIRLGVVCLHAAGELVAV